MCVTPAVVFGIYCTSRPGASWVPKIVSGRNSSPTWRQLPHGVAHALGHGPPAHAHGGGHVGGPHRGHGGAHPMMWGVKRLHRWPGEVKQMKKYFKNILKKYIFLFVFAGLSCVYFCQIILKIIETYWKISKTEYYWKFSWIF